MNELAQLAFLVFWESFHPFQRNSCFALAVYLLLSIVHFCVLKIARNEITSCSMDKIFSVRDDGQYGHPFCRYLIWFWIQIDIHQWRPDGYVAKVTISNCYKYRHIIKPGWQLGWTWSHDEIIWSMAGALATQQGNCSTYQAQIPHSCKKDPLIVDLMPDAGAKNRFDNCCRGGLLTANAIDPSTSFTSFEIIVGQLDPNSFGYKPQNLTLLAPGSGYTCGSFEDQPPTVTPVVNGRREEQVFSKTLNSC